jgi:hypothetical protein
LEKNIMDNQNAGVLPMSLPPIDHDVFLSNFGEKDRKGIARHLAVSEETLGAAVTERWWRFAHVLMALAPHPAKLVARQAIQFYIPDGKYRMQVFALETLKYGALAVYIDNVLDEAARAGILTGPMPLEGQTVYRISSAGETLDVTAIDVLTLDPPPVCKGMTGWHRKAICVKLPIHPSDAQIQAAEKLCALAATRWAAAA